MGHDVIVIGASAGGIEALSNLVAALPADLPACLCIVQHLSSTRESYLPRILNQAGTLPVRFANDGDPLQHGRVYIAPRDRHLVITPESVAVVMGPRENNFRPAVDPLFRSAAVAHGQRVIGVVLSGALDCGTAGLLAIKRCGGVALVQDPDEALVADMPRSAIDNVPVDGVLPLRELAAKLIELARTEPRARAKPPTRQIEQEVKIDQMAPEAELLPPLGTPAGLTCPNCAGPLYEMSDGPQLRFRCRVGHAFGGAALSAEQQNTTEGAFWAALRALEEQAALARRLATRARELGQRHNVAQFEERAVTAEHQARIVREELLRSLAPSADAEATGDPTTSVKH
jgi:two-component system chemotaxis response regulator CheB